MCGLVDFFFSFANALRACSLWLGRSSHGRPRILLVVVFSAILESRETLKKCVSDCDSGLSSGILVGSLLLSIALGEMFASEIGYTPQGCVAGLLFLFPLLLFFLCDY
jgi:hypothetical protein